MYKRYLKIGGISRKEISTLELDSFDRFRSFYSLKKLSLHKNVMEINIKDYMLLENKKNVGIIKKKLRENRLKDWFVITGLCNGDIILVVRVSIYSLDTSIISPWLIKDRLTRGLGYELDKFLLNSNGIKKYKNISEIMKWDGLSRYIIRKSLKTCGIVNKNNKIYIKYDGLSCSRVWEDISRGNIIGAQRGSGWELKSRVKLIGKTRDKDEEGSRCLSDSVVIVGKPLISSTSWDAGTSLKNIILQKKWGVLRSMSPKGSGCSGSQPVNVNSILLDRGLSNFVNKLDRLCIHPGSSSFSNKIFLLDGYSFINWKTSQLKISLLELSHSGPWNIFSRKYSLPRRGKGRRKLIWKKKSHCFISGLEYVRKLLWCSDSINDVVWGSWKKKRYTRDYLNKTISCLVSDNNVSSYLEGYDLKDSDLRRILKKDKDKKPRWKSIFHLYSRWWLPIKDPLLNINCNISVGLFISNKIMEYKRTGKIIGCIYWRELCSSVDINLSNILLSKIVYIIRKILNIEYNLLGILKLENVLLTAIYNGEFSNISRKSIVYNVIHKLINKEEVLNKYSYSSCKEYNLEVCLNNSLKSRILDKSNCVNSRGLICGTIGIREYSNITTSSKLDYSLFCLDRLSYLKEFYGMNCCNKELLLTIINNYTSNNLCRLPFHKPRLYPIRNNQWLRYPWYFSSEVFLLKKTLLNIILENKNDYVLFDWIMDCIINKSSLRLNERDRLLCYIFSKSPVTLWKKWINSIYDKDMYLHLIKEGSK